MEFAFLEFKVGQKWKTRMGHRYIIKEIRDDEAYPLVCISMETGKKHFFDDEGYETAGWPTDNDLVERIS